MINMQLILRKPHKSVVMENLDFRKTHYPSFPFVVRKLKLWLPLGDIRLPGLQGRTGLTHRSADAIA